MMMMMTRTTTRFRVAVVAQVNVLLLLSLCLLLLSDVEGWITTTSRTLPLVVERRGGGISSSSKWNSIRTTPTTSNIQLFASTSKNDDNDNDNDDDEDDDSVIWTEEDLLDYCSSKGIVLSLTTLGPGYRAVVRAKQNTSLILGYCEGFLRPGGTILHLDKMEVFQKMIQKAAANSNSKDMYGAGSGTFFGVGLLLGYYCLLHGKSNGRTIAEFLAIDDEAKQHRKLVRYYQRSGFQIIKYVGEDITNVPDRLIWGGCGTLMRVDDITVLLQKWTKTLKRSQIKQQQQQAAQAAATATATTSEE